MTESNSASNPPHVVIAAGGTGGHMFPAQAFAQEMAARSWRVGLVTDERGLRYADNLPAEWIEQVPAASVGSKRPDKVLAALMRIHAGSSLAKRKMKSDKPALVVGFGGYPSFPTLWAARGMRTPIIIHEQNAVLGRVNRVFANAADFVACGFERLDRLPGAAVKSKRVVGNPVRAPIMEVRETPYPAVEGDGMITVLITGGSQGAKMFGDIAPAAIAGLDPVLRRRLHIMQQAREDQVDAVKAVYQEAGVECVVQPFFSDMHERLARAHLVIARSGAGTVTELCVTGRPSILIPLGIAMDDHQRANAEALEAAGGADVILEQDFNTQTLSEKLMERLGPNGDLPTRAAAAHALAPGDAAKELASLAEKAAAH